MKPDYRYSSVVVFRIPRLSPHSNRTPSVLINSKLLLFFLDIPIAPSIDDTAVFANNELDLTNVDVYGFDYDYTLASYTKALHHLIYSLGQYALVNNHKVGPIACFYSAPFKLIKIC